MPSHSKCLSLLYSSDFLSYLSSLQILVVGAGGIGCELLKVLSKFTFSHICIIDLDTIEVSNLNRQFLFRKEHKGLSKAEIAKKTLESLNPLLKITAFQANIKEFGIIFFKSYDVIFSALDNAEARSYINTVCVALNKPLLEAGTTGFKGQAMLLKRGVSRCYDCEPKGINKTYQVCTIRTLPEIPLHCIIWAKYLFGVLFGPSDEGNLLEDLREKFQEFKENMHEIVFQELFDEQIKKQINADPKKFEKLRPISLTEIESMGDNNSILEETSETKQKIYPISSYVQLFLYTFKNLMELKKNLSFITFEKDDDLIIKFITATSNIRAYIFNIELLNEFQTKEIAGNIIPAICSTNAIVAAIEVSEALKYLRYLYKQREFTNNKECYVQNDVEKKINAINPLKPNAKCLVCNESLVPCLVLVNMHNFTLGDFFEKIVKRIGENIPNCTLTQGNLLIYEQGDYLEEDELMLYEKKLSQSFADIFKGLIDMKLTLTLNETHYIKFLIVHDNILSATNFSLENDFISRNLGDLKELMVNNKIDYDEQLKQEENMKKAIKTLKDNDNGMIELDESVHGDEDIIMEDRNDMKSKLKRSRPNDVEEIIEEKTTKHLKID